MTNEDLKEYLQKHLTVSVSTTYASWGDHSKVIVTLLLDGEEISTDYGVIHKDMLE